MINEGYLEEISIKGLEKNDNYTNDEVLRGKNILKQRFYKNYIILR